MISITIRDLTKRFGDTLALDHVSLRVEPGELFFLLGPSGCGKTTLLRHVAGFLQPDQGSILFDDEDVSHIPPHKRNTGMMFQSYALWPHMNVAQNVAFGLEERKTPRVEIRQRVQEALDAVHMGAHAQRRITQLSGGQQQRVALARALVIRPRCLLLDEPLSNLDAKLRLEMRSEIRRVCKEYHLTAIYVTHDQKEALSVSDRICVLDSGRVAQIGSAREIYQRPQSRQVAEFIGETNFIPATVRSRSGTSAQITVETDAGHFEGTLTNSTWNPHPGEKVTLSIRPESWMLCESRQSLNCITGTLGECTYLGESAQYFMQAGPLRVKVVEMNPRFTALEPGRTIHATVSPEDVIVLRH
jgi:iron(III) transport system ATP-binding protein